MQGVFPLQFQVSVNVLSFSSVLFAKAESAKRIVSFFEMVVSLEGDSK